MASFPAVAGADWGERCAYWLNAKTTPQRPIRRRRQTHEPLILTGHGMSLRIDHGALVVRNGFTHYPQSVGEKRFFPGDRTLPLRIIVLDGSGALSFEALTWLSQQGIPLIRINWRGDVVTAIGAGHATDPKRVASQLEVQRNGHALPLAISLIRQKIRNSIDTLTEALPRSLACELALTKLRGEMNEITNRPPRSIRSLLGIEGRAAFAYLNAWQSLPLRWKGTSCHPIPPDWRCIGQRQSFARHKGRNKNASHPINAILNYAYAILESQIRIQILAAGYDPTIGLLHLGRIGRGRHDFVLDLMEPLRPIVDRKVLEFVQTHTFHPADFTIRSDGVCRLNSEMARNVVELISRGTTAELALNVIR